MLGRIVKHVEPMQQSAGDQLVVLGASELQAGTYYLTMTIDGVQQGYPVLKK